MNLLVVHDKETYLNSAGEGVRTEPKHFSETELTASCGGAIKKVGEDVYGGYLVAFTESDERDLQGEWFDEHTDFMIGVYPVKGLPALYHHGFDVSIGSVPIGSLAKAKVEKGGIYVETKLDFQNQYKLYLTELQAPDDWKVQQEKKAEQYHQMLRRMLDGGELGWSSGAHPPGVRVAPGGHIDRWPIWEATATLTPAMPKATGIERVKIVSDDRMEQRRRFFLE